MAQLKDLIVAGSSRFLSNVYFEDSVTLNDTLILAKSTDLQGTADNRPALIVGGLPAAAHIEFDSNEIQSKTSDTTVGPLYINKDGGNTNIGANVIIVSDGSAATSTTGAIRVTGGISASNTSYFGGALNVSGLATFSGYIRAAKGEAATSATSGDIRVDGGIGVAKDSYFGSSVVVNGKLTVKGNTVLGDAESDTITIKGKTSITGPVTITGNTTHNGIVYFANGTTYYIDNSGIGILNELTMLNSIYFGQNKSYHIANTGTGYLNALTTNGAVKMNGGTDSNNISTGQLVVIGGVGISKKLTVGDAVTFNNTLSVENNTALKGILDVSGVTTLKNALNVIGTSTLTGATSIKSTLTVTSTSNLNDDVTMAAKAIVNGATELKDTLTVTKTATFNKDVIINGGTESNNMITGQLKVVGGIGATKYISAKALRLDDKVEFIYNSTDKCVDIIFK